MTLRLASPIAVLLSSLALAGSSPAVAADAPAAASPPPAVAAPAPATTAPTSSSPASPAVKAEARERFDRGLHLFEKGENAGALAEFKRAYQLIPTPVVLYNMGLVYAAMNRPVDSVDALAQFLADAGDTGAEQKKHAEQVHAEQTKRIAQLVVLTDHPATIEVDGVEVGRTPLAKPIRVASGSHVVAVEAPGFLGSRREVTLAGQLTETIAMGMEPTDTRMAQLVVSAVIPGAEVLVNGKRVGATPLPASVAVPPGKVKVELQRAGYLTAAQTIALDEGARGELSFTLEEDPAASPSLRGRLVVTSSELGTDIIVDGSARHPLGGPLTMPVGPHRVRLEKVGYEPAERGAEVINGQDATLLVTMVATPEHQAELDSSRSSRKTIGWSVVAVGAAVAIGGGVVALLGNSDLTSARSDFNTNVTVKNSDPASFCRTVGSIDYVSHHCEDVRAAYQKPVDNATLKRNIGFGVAAAGVVAAGVGVVLLATGSSSSGAGVATAQVWGDGHSGGIAFAGRF